MKAASTLFRRGRVGFTLLEVLLVLALVGMLAGLFISAAGGLTTGKVTTAEDFFWQGVGEARKQALMAGRNVRMVFVPAGRDEPAALVLNLEGVEQRVPFELKEEVKLDFLSTQKAKATILVAGELVETQTMPSVTFYGDGTCTPFRVQIRTGGGNARTLAIDPWTCAQVLPSAEGAR
ncbi:MAG: prepilin-type N-terminal cleavage/methylation domain-containing protein [Nibricoccus sp.]